MSGSSAEDRGLMVRHKRLSQALWRAVMFDWLWPVRRQLLVSSTPPSHKGCFQTVACPICTESVPVNLLSNHVSSCTAPAKSPVKAGTIARFHPNIPQTTTVLCPETQFEMSDGEFDSGDEVPATPPMAGKVTQSRCRVSVT